uniref:TEA domain transcription factor 1 n=1 Tax=Ailuropoda melanoleuca TaxID=9646 RepID=A0A7N5JZR2_AILME
MRTTITALGRSFLRAKWHNLNFRKVYFLEKAPGFGLENPTAKIEPSSWSGSESPAENMERMSDSADKPIDNDAEGVWSPDIEQSFQEALAIYPPCGRRKIILSDEGKMYGRNELIARYIKLRTGKTRTRKQVSSHIQVLARKKVREIQAAIKVSSHIQVLARRKSRDFHSKLKVTSMDQTAKDKALQHMAAMSSAQIVSATAIHNKLGLPGIPRPAFPGAPGFWPGMIQTGQPGSSQDVKPFVQQAYPIQPAVTAPIPGFEPASAPAPSVPAWQGRSIGTTKLRLVEFSAFLEQQRDPDSADLNCSIQDDAGAFYGVTSQYESSENMTVTCSTKVCSFGKQVVEKVETEYARFENGRFVYRINRSPMCEYMINFIHKLKHLPEKYMMNSVLENFTILLVVTNRDTQETLLCMACVFEVSNSEHGAQHHIYRMSNQPQASVHKGAPRTLPAMPSPPPSSRRDPRNCCVCVCVCPRPRAPSLPITWLRSRARGLPRKRQTFGQWTDLSFPSCSCSVSVEAFFSIQTTARTSLAYTVIPPGSWKPRTEMRVQNKNELGSLQLKCSSYGENVDSECCVRMCHEKLPKSTVHNSAFSKNVPALKRATL